MASLDSELYLRIIMETFNIISTFLEKDAGAKIE